MGRLVVIAVVGAAIAMVPGLVSANGLTKGTLGDAGWTCDLLAPDHCANPAVDLGALQPTTNVMVFDAEGEFVAAETRTTNPLAGDRPCPTDPESPDGTWWEPVPGINACHHQSE